MIQLPHNLSDLATSEYELAIGASLWSRPNEIRVLCKVTAYRKARGRGYTEVSVLNPILKMRHGEHTM